MIYHDLIVVGGGASGLTAAIIAKDFGIDVAIVEGTDRIGKKFLLLVMDAVIYQIIGFLIRILLIIVKTKVSLQRL